MRLATTLVLVSTLSAFGAGKVKIASVPDEFRPFSGPGGSEPVSMSGYRFEVNQETVRARLVVDYSYRNQPAYESDDHHRPESSYVQLPGLIYDAAAKQVVYVSASDKTVCATVAGRKIRSTGNCVVTAARGDHAEDNGWSIQHSHTLDTYLETR